MAVLCRLSEAVQTHDAVVCVVFIFALLGNAWATVRQAFTRCHLLYIFLTYESGSIFLSGDTHLHLHGERWIPSETTGLLLLISGHICSGAMPLYYQEIKLGKEYEGTHKGLFTVCEWYFIHFFLRLLYFSCLSISAPVACGLVSAESQRYFPRIWGRDVVSAHPGYREVRETRKCTMSLQLMTLTHLHHRFQSL